MNKKNKWIRIGICGVDSGQVIIADPCYVLPNDTGDIVRDEDYTYQKLLKHLGKNNHMDLHNEIVFAGIAGTGVRTNTGYGDGGYPVEARHSDDGRVAEVRIKFIDD